jgi:hypothetical protein
VILEPPPTDLLETADALVLWREAPSLEADLGEGILNVSLTSARPSLESPRGALEMEDFRLYRAQAASFERQAALARRAGARAEFLELARLWSKLADETERVARGKALAMRGKDS